MDGSERLRLFCALRLPDEAVEQLAAWQARVLTAGRAVVPGNLHVTLAFLGSRSSEELPAIAGALRAAAAGVGEIGLRLGRYRETRSVGMLVFEDESGHGAALAGRLHASLSGLGIYEPERRPWFPHLTVVRFRERPRLQPGLPELDRVVPSDAAVFISRLRPGGAAYEAVEVVPLSATDVGGR